MRKQSRIILSLVCLGLLICPAIGQPDEPFADALFQAEDYRAAVLEYERLLFFQPDTVAKGRWLYRLGLSRQNDSQCNRAVDDFLKVPNSNEWADSSKLQCAECYLTMGQPQKAIAVLNGIQLEQASLTIGYANLMLGEYGIAASSLRAMHGSNTTALQLKGLSEIADSLARFRTKHYFPAGILALVPGLGHLYTGRYGDGLFSFSVVASFGGIAYYYYHHDAKGRAGVMGTISGLFYVGSVYGSVVSVKIYNRERPKRLRQRARRVYLGK